MSVYQIVSLIDRLVGVLSTCFFVFLLFGFYPPSLAILSLVTVGIHESGHLFALFFIGKKAGRLKRRLNGFVLDCPSLSYEEERTVAVMGPLFNLFSAIIAYFLLPLAPGYLSDFAVLSLLTGLFNLCPVEGYDGERILSSFLSQKVSFTSAYAHKRAFSFLFILTFLFLSLYFLRERGEGYFVFGVFFYTFLSFLKNSRICEKTRI